MKISSKDVQIQFVESIKMIKERRREKQYGGF